MAPPVRGISAGGERVGWIYRDLGQPAVERGVCMPIPMVRVRLRDIRWWREGRLDFPLLLNACV